MGYACLANFEYFHILHSYNLKSIWQSCTISGRHRLLVFVGWFIFLFIFYLPFECSMHWNSPSDPQADNVPERHRQGCEGCVLVCVCVLLCVCVERNWRQQVKFRVHSACLIELSCCLVSKQCPASQMSGLVTWVRLRFCLCEYVCVCVSVCLCLLSWCLSAHSFVRCIKPVYRNTRLKANHRQLHSDLTILPTHPFLFSLPLPCPPSHPPAPSLPAIVLGP